MSATVVVVSSRWAMMEERRRSFRVSLPGVSVDGMSLMGDDGARLRGMMMSSSSLPKMETEDKSVDNAAV